jgi:hypothetical protein
LIRFHRLYLIILLSNFEWFLKEKKTHRKYDKSFIFIFILFRWSIIISMQM